MRNTRSLVEIHNMLLDVMSAQEVEVSVSAVVEEDAEETVQVLTEIFKIYSNTKDSTKLFRLKDFVGRDVRCRRCSASLSPSSDHPYPQTLK